MSEIAADLLIFAKEIDRLARGEDALCGGLTALGDEKRLEEVVYC